MLTRAAGVLIPLFSMNTNFDLGRGEILDLAHIIDLAHDMGLSLVQLLPLDEGAPGETSPYSAMSVFAVDPLYLSAHALAGVGPATLEAARRKIGTASIVPRTTLESAKMALLDRAWRTASRASGSSREFQSFAAENREWLDDYALFRVLKQQLKWSPWEQWPAELRDHKRSALEVARKELAEPIARYSWFQFIAHQQWSAMRAIAVDRGVMFGGDMAFMPSRESAEVWANQQVFDLTRTVGAPPDAFNEKGQRWGLPLPLWKVMRADGFRLWRARVKRAAAMFDLLRIDHVVGLYRTFSFGPVSDTPGSFSPADESAQLKQGEEILKALCEAAAPCQLIAEDLGIIPDWVRISLTRLQIPGYKVLRWEREGWGTDNERWRKVAQYPELALATTGTHDTDPLAAWWRKQTVSERAGMLEALAIQSEGAGRRELDTSLFDAIIEGLYKSPAKLVVLPIQDFFGWDDQINQPGTINDSNWTWRLPSPLEEWRGRPRIRQRIARLRAIACRTGRAEEKPGPNSH